MNSTWGYSLDRKLDFPLNSFKAKAAGFCKHSTDVVVVKFTTARESNDRQTFYWMNSIRFNQIQNLSLFANTAGIKLLTNASMAPV